MRIIFIMLVMFNISAELSYCSFDIKTIDVDADKINTIICDFNHDNISDIITLKSPLLIILYKGNGDLTFYKYAEYSIDFSNFLIFDDFNNDGIKDLLFRNGIMPGNNTGGFDGKVNINIDGRHAISSDFNNDGFKDIFTNTGLYINNGNLSFSGPISTNIDSIRDIIPLSTSDFDNDGFMDLSLGYELLTDEYGNNTPDYTYCMGILFGPINEVTNRRFSTITEYGRKGNIGDFNNDNHSDVLLMENSIRYETYMNNGEGIFNLVWTYERLDYNWKVSNHSILFDGNKDGKLDILCFGCITPDGDFSNKYSIMTGRGDGTFNPEEFCYYSGYDVINVIVSDINNDINNEIILLCSNGIYVLSVVNSTYIESDIIDNINFYNYPNPFNPSTTIEFEISHRDEVVIDVYNISGQFVERLVDRIMDKGYHQVTWNAKGKPSGIYLLVLESGGMRNVQKVMLIK